MADYPKGDEWSDLLTPSSSHAYGPPRFSKCPRCGKTRVDSGTYVGDPPSGGFCNGHRVGDELIRDHRYWRRGGLTSSTTTDYCEAPGCGQHVSRHYYI